MVFDSGLTRMFRGGNSDRKSIGGRYAVGRDGVVYSDGLPLKAVGGTWVSIGGERRLVSYLVARAFVPNPRGCEFVRHRNGDPTDNRAENLEWCEAKEPGRRRGPKPGLRRIGQYDLDGNLVAWYVSVSEAAKCSGLKAADVRAAAGRKGKTGGWRWMWL